MPHVAVVGAGVIGVATAVRIQDEIPDASVTIISERFSPETTGDGSAGFWEPYILADTPPEDVLKWSGSTYRLLRDLWRGEEAWDTGVTLIPATWVTQDPEKMQVPLWKDAVMGYRPLCPRQLDRLGRWHGKTYTSGFQFVSFTCEPTRFLPFLTKRFVQRGGRVKRGRVESLDGIAAGYDVVVNCTGLGARHLVGDAGVVPVRGQVTRVDAPWIFEVILDDSDKANYIIPNQESVVLGGTGQRGDWNVNVCPKDDAFIHEGCCRMYPGLKHSKVLRKWVGLRPGRQSVRIERESISKNGQQIDVVHNYGHGGSGITLCWGCAQDTTDIVRTILGEKRAAGKLTSRM